MQRVRVQQHRLLADDLFEQDGLEREPEAPLLDQLDVEEVVDQVTQPLSLAVNRLDVRLPGLRVALVRGEQFPEAEDSREGRTELVRDSGDEIGFQLLRFALGGDVAQGEDPAEHRAAVIVDRPAVALDPGAGVRELVEVDSLALGVRLEPVHRLQVGIGIHRALSELGRRVPDRFALGKSYDQFRHLLQRCVGDHRPAVEVDHPDRVRRRVEHRALDVRESVYVA